MATTTHAPRSGEGRSTSTGGDSDVLDVEEVRRQFPALHQDVNGRPLVYLDNAASAHKPRRVIEGVARYYAEDHSNVHRGVHTLSQRATSAFEQARGRVRQFLNAERDEEIVFVRGCTEGINLVAASWGRANLEAGDEILLTEMEHHSNIVPWQMVAAETGARIRVARVRDDGRLDMKSFREHLGPRTRLVAVVHASNALGTINPVEEIVSLAHDEGALVLLDGAQGAVHGHVDVRALGCDFYAFSGHKVYGPMGIGALYGRYELLESMPPYQGGGDMVETVSFEGTTYADPPARFEAGTPNVAGAVGLGIAVDWLDGMGWDAICAHEQALLERGRAALSGIDGLRIIGDTSDKAPVFSFVIDGLHPHDIGTILDMHGVAVRTGQHCTEPLMKRFGVPGTTRASFALYNTLEEVDRLVAAIGAARKMLA